MHDNFVSCPQEALEWNSRRYHIVEEIVEYCPDVICLQVGEELNTQFFQLVLNETENLKSFSGLGLVRFRIKSLVLVARFSYFNIHNDLNGKIIQ